MPRVRNFSQPRRTNKTYSIKLTPEEQDQLTAISQAQGKTPSTILTEIVRSQLAQGRDDSQPDSTADKAAGTAAS